MKRATLALSLWDVKEEEQKVGSRDFRFVQN